MIILALCASLCMMTFTTALPNGAPTAACSTMTPIHRSFLPQQLSGSPFTVAVAPTATPNSFTITVSSNGPQFRGIMLQARSSEDGLSLGTWNAPTDPNFKLINCHGNAAGTVTHDNRADKAAPVEFIWNAPPSETPVNYVVYVTVVQTLETFYPRIPSPPIQFPQPPPPPIVPVTVPPPVPPVTVPDIPLGTVPDAQPGTIPDAQPGTTPDAQPGTIETEVPTKPTVRPVDSATPAKKMVESTSGQVAGTKSSFALAVLLVAVVQWFRRFFV